MKPKDLVSYLKKNKLSVHDFSYIAKVTPPTIYTFLEGIKVRPATIEKLKKAMLNEAL